MTEQPSTQNLSVQTLFSAYGEKVLDLLELAKQFSIPYSGKGAQATFTPEDYSKMEAHLRMASQRKQSVKQYIQAVVSSQKSAEPLEPQGSKVQSKTDPQNLNQWQESFDPIGRETGKEALNDQSNYVAQAAQAQATNALVGINVMTAYYIQNPQAIANPDFQAQLHQSQEFLGKSLTNNPLIQTFSLPGLLNSIGTQFNDQKLLQLESQIQTIPSLPGSPSEEEEGEQF